MYDDVVFDYSFRYELTYVWTAYIDRDIWHLDTDIAYEIAI